MIRGLVWAAVCAAGCADRTVTIGRNPAPALGCHDGTLNADESDVDCGGANCSGCGLAARCGSDADCESGMCIASQCSTFACSNSIRDETETDVDCGGSVCARCSVGLSCHIDADCASSTCVDGLCSPSEGAPGSGGAPGAPGTGGSDSGGAESAEDFGAGGIGDTNQPPIGACPGCARLRVEIDDRSDRADFAISLPATVNFSNALVTFRVYRGMGSGGSVKGYLQHGADDFDQLIQRDGQALDETYGWTEFVWNVGAEPTPFDKSRVERLGIRVSMNDTGNYSAPVLIYVDSIVVTGAPAGPWLFETVATISTNPALRAPANVMWLDLDSDPTPGSMLEWFNRR